jgi:hypothetical protein
MPARLPVFADGIISPQKDLMYERPGAQEVCSKRRRGKELDLVLFWSLDRFSREGVLETLQHLKRLSSYGVESLSQVIDRGGHVVLGVSMAARAEVWNANCRRSEPRYGKPGSGFPANEFWIHAGDSVRWTFVANELHAVNFLQPGYARPPLYGPVFGVFVRCRGKENWSVERELRSVHANLSSRTRETS